MKVVRYKMLGLNDSLLSLRWVHLTTKSQRWNQEIMWNHFDGPALRGVEPKSWPGSIKARVQPYQP